MRTGDLSFNLPGQSGSDAGPNYWRSHDKRAPPPSIVQKRALCACAWLYNTVIFLMPSIPKISDLFNVLLMQPFINYYNYTIEKECVMMKHNLEL